MSADAERCCEGPTCGEATCAEILADAVPDEQAPAGVDRIVDSELSMLIAAGAAMACNCGPCLNKAVSGLVRTRGAPRFLPLPA